MTNMCKDKGFWICLLQVTLLLGVVAFFLWLSLRPSPPNYTIVDFSIPTDPLNQTNAASFQLQIKNPNQFTDIFYDDTSLMFYYGDDTLGERTVPGFHQKRRKTTKVYDRLDVDGKIWKKLVNVIANATAELKVAVETKIRYGRKGKHHGLNSRGKMKIGSDGKIHGKKKQIKLHRSSKKWH